MTDDDFIKTANYMEQKVREELRTPRGHFKTYYWEAIRSIALAYYHADLGNQRIMRKTFAAVFEEFNTARQEAA